MTLPLLPLYFISIKSPNSFLALIGHGSLGKVDGKDRFCWFLCYFAKICRPLLWVSALWSTRQTENTAENRELQIKVTLRELLVYLVFLIDTCIGELNVTRLFEHLLCHVCTLKDAIFVT